MITSRRTAQSAGYRLGREQSRGGEDEAIDRAERRGYDHTLDDAYRTATAAADENCEVLSVSPRWARVFCRAYIRGSVGITRRAIEGMA